MRISRLLLLFIAAWVHSPAFSKPSDRSVETRPALQPLAPEESMKRIKLPPGFRLELVASEPQIREPVALCWDGNGRMYVAEMRGYMQDIEGTGARDPVGRISRLEDTDGDGVMDKHSVYLDHLVEPRAVLAVDDGLLVGEPPDLWYCRDTDGDGMADHKERVFDKFSMRRSNVEHKANGLLWGIDNWIHVSQHDHRYQLITREVRNERIPVVGQWGLARSDEGRLLFSSNGTPAIGLFVPPRSLWHDSNREIRRGPMAGAVRHIGDYQSVWPSMVTPDLQAGPGWARPGDGSLRGFTSACGQTIFRGDRLGDEINGDYFVCEPVGRLIRRSKVRYAESGHIELTNRHEKDLGEFISATDGNFRPVNCYTGPDGCLYIVDMYHGIIQERAYITPYLREQIVKAGYEKNIGRGRIYRVVREGVQPGARPRLLEATTQELVAHLSHPNGWWRDTAQSLLVTRGETSVREDLAGMVRTHSNPLARLHALWTMDGLGVASATTVKEAAADEDHRLRVAALRVAESLPWQTRPGPDPITALIRALAEDPHPEVAAQGLITFRKRHAMQDPDLLAKCFARHPGNERIFYSAVASMAGEQWSDLISFLASQPSFRDGPLSAQDSSNLQFLGRLYAKFIVAEKHAPAMARLLDLAGEAPEPVAVSLLTALKDSLPRRKANKPHKPIPTIRFDAKPGALATLEQRPEPAIREHLAPVASFLSWPGLPSYQRDLNITTAPLQGHEAELFKRGHLIYRELCTSCHGPDGLGVKAPQGDVLLAPPLPASPRLEENREAAIQIMLHGLIGELDGQKYEGLMAPFGATNEDEWVASVLTYVRREWGNAGSVVHPPHVASVREKFKERKTPWTQAELDWALGESRTEKDD